MSNIIADCILCQDTGGQLIWNDNQCRVIAIHDSDYPGYCRVVWNEHRTEMTDLLASERHHFMRVVFATEAAVRTIASPTKINLASLGNMTPHLHWHVIARYLDDKHFPQAIWGPPQRDGSPRQNIDLKRLATLIAQNLAEEQGGDV